MGNKFKPLPSLGITDWDQVSLPNLVEKITSKSPKPLILIDGAAGSGKTTLAKILAERLQANLVLTDELCWNADPVQWDGEMLDNIILPWQAGNDVTYRPTGWVKENRLGSLDVDPDKALIIEGMGAIRKTLREKATFSIWVDVEPGLARARVIERDLASGADGGTVESITGFADWWDSLLNPLFIEEKPWEFADVIISGASQFNSCFFFKSVL